MTPNEVLYEKTALELERRLVSLRLEHNQLVEAALAISGIENEIESVGKRLKRIEGKRPPPYKDGELETEFDRLF